MIVACRYCGHEGKPVRGQRVRFKRSPVLLCPSCRGVA